MILLVDGNNLARRAFATMELTTPSGKDVSAIYGTIKMVKHAVEKLKPEKVVVAWDVGKSEYRCSIYEDYKSQRKVRTTEEEDRYKTFLSQAEELRMSLEHLGIINVWQQGVEADDLLYAVVRKNRKKDIVILTNDRDLLQVVNRKVAVFLPLYHEKGKVVSKLVTTDNFKEVSTLSTVERFIQYKTLIGDSSDGIPGVKGIGKKSALLLLEEKGYTIESMLANPPEELRKSTRLGNILKSSEVLIRNNKLVRLSHAYENLDLTEALERLEEPPLKSYSSFKSMCLKNSFVSILSDFSAWRNAFDSIGGEA